MPAVAAASSAEPIVPVSFLDVTMTPTVLATVELVGLPPHSTCSLCASVPLLRVLPPATTGSSLDAVVDRRDVASGIYEGVPAK